MVAGQCDIFGHITKKLLGKRKNRYFRKNYDRKCHTSLIKGLQESKTEAKKLVNKMEWKKKKGGIRQLILLERSGEIIIGAEVERYYYGAIIWGCKAYENKKRFRTLEAAQAWCRKGLLTNLGELIMNLNYQIHIDDLKGEK
jgi:hypothetical protein